MAHSQPRVSGVEDARTPEKVKYQVKQALNRTQISSVEEVSGRLKQ